MADAIHADANLGLTKQEIIISAVQRELQFSAKLVPTISDISRFASPGLKSISFPKLGSFSIAKRVEGVAGDATVINATLDQLDLDQNAYVAWIVDSMTAIQANISSEAELAVRAASAHGRQVDTDIIAQLGTNAGYSINAGVPADVADDDILEMMKFVECNDGQLENSVFVFSCDQRKALLSLTRFSSNDVFGSPVIKTGVIGSLYGVPVMFHNGMGTQQAFLYEKASMAIGFQSTPKMDDQPANEYGVGARRHAMDQLYGIQGQQLGEKSLGATESPLIVKLRD